MVRLQKVSFSYSTGGKPVFADLDLEIEPLSWVAVSGPNGSGKTTLAKLIKGIIRPDSGTVQTYGNPTLDVGYLGGDPYDSLIGVSVEEDVAFGLESLRMPVWEMRERVTQSLEWTGLSGMEKRLIETLSGGEQQQVALAGVLAMRCRVLVLDEAFNMLDKPTRMTIRALISKLRRNLGLTVIEVTNNLEDVLACEKVIFLSEGKVSFYGPSAEFIKSAAGGKWSAMTGSVYGLIATLFRLGVLPEPSKDRSDLTSFLLTRDIR
jgi:energy-coupling factor transport system ATP-binding protein